MDPEWMRSLNFEILQLITDLFVPYGISSLSLMLKHTVNFIPETSISTVHVGLQSKRLLCKFVTLHIIFKLQSSFKDLHIT